MQCLYCICNMYIKHYKVIDFPKYSYCIIYIYIYLTSEPMGEAHIEEHQHYVHGEDDPTSSDENHQGTGGLHTEVEGHGLRR